MFVYELKFFIVIFHPKAANSLRHMEGKDEELSLVLIHKHDTSYTIYIND